MIGKISNILTGAQNAITQSIKNTQRILDKVQLRLASGKDVNSALDNPANFFLSLSLSQKADDLSRLIDGISSNIRAIEQAMTGSDAILNLIDQAAALLDEAEAELYADGITSLISELSDEDIAAILAVNPGLVYFPGNRSFYMLGGVANWATSNANAQAATINEPQGVDGVQGVTGHLANITSQEENDFINALAPGNVWLGGGDGAVEGEWRWLAGPEAGQQFWQGGVAGNTVGGSYANWGAGEPNNSGNEDTVHMRADGRWNDQPGGTAYNYVIEWDSSLFTPPVDPDLVARAAQYAKQYSEILEQIDLLAKDSHYRGLGLLNGEDLRTDFNPERTNFLITEGIDATSSGLGLLSHNFLRLSTLSQSQTNMREARSTMRGYAGNLATDFSIVSVRFDFTRDSVNVHEDGASKLVDADKNEEGAELLALQVRQRLQIEALRLSTEAKVTQLF
jgi:flagellin-like hook-associated protein FlgL